jgi:hypothetical protein
VHGSATASMTLQHLDSDRPDALSRQNSIAVGDQQLRSDPEHLVELAEQPDGTVEITLNTLKQRSKTIGLIGELHYSRADNLALRNDCRTQPV